MPGCGRSSDPRPTFRLPDYADCLASPIGALHVHRPHVLGLSFGVAVPTLLLHGDQDLRSPVEVGRALHEGIPGSSLVILPCVGHLSSVEGAEQFNREVRSFLAMNRD